MNITESIVVALAGLRTNMMRTFLTMLGIIIGIASVISIFTVGSGVSGKIQNSMSSMGVKNITVNLQEKHPDDSMYSTAPKKIDPKNLLTPEMIDAARTRFSNEIVDISITEGGVSGKVNANDSSTGVTLTGINEGYAKLNGLQILAGRNIKHTDEANVRAVGMISDVLLKQAFGGDVQRALGAELLVDAKADTHVLSIIGVYKYTPGPFGPPPTGVQGGVVTPVYLPVSTMKQLSNADPGYTNFTIGAAANVPAEELSGRLSEFFNRYYANNEEYSIQCSSIKKLVQQTNSMMSTISLGLSVIGGISLLVGGIGVMNIMLVSVTERTREIGVRKALGASNNNIRVQFVVESMIVCVIGGAIGVGLGSGLGYFGSQMLGSPAIPSIGSILFSLGFSLAIGVFFGYYPANKAAQMDPIEALRYE